MTFDEMTATGTIEIAAAPAAVYELISNVVRIPDYSPECVKCEWDGSYTAAAVGETFHGTNKIGDFEWTTVCQIVTAEPGTTFAFQVDGGANDGAAATWTYSLSPTGSGTQVTETFAIGPSAGGYRRFGKSKTDEEQAAMAAARCEQLTGAIATTLEKLKAAAES